MERLVRGLPDDAMLKQALALAERATELDPYDARGLRERGFCCLYLKRHDESLNNFRKAAELNPNDADLLADYADALAHSGKPEMARDMCVRALTLNPMGPDYYNWILGSIHYQIGDYETAIAVLEPVKDNPGTARLLAACSAMAGRRSDAHHYAAIVRDTYPDFRLQHLFDLVPDKDLSDTQHLIEGLQRARLE
jgi:tetratricopeptide (TPR) repeat protein